jgi:hypothetical protein
MLEDVGAEAAAAVEAAAGELASRLGDIRVTPRFRTPLERELTSRAFGPLRRLRALPHHYRIPFDTHLKSYLRVNPRRTSSVDH